MSWDVVILARQLDDAHPQPVAIGDADEVRGKIARTWPGVDWSDPSWGHYGGEGWTMVIHVQHQGPIEVIGLEIRGGGDPVSAIGHLCQEWSWVALDGSSMEYLEFDSPAKSSWEAYRNFRDQVVE